MTLADVVREQLWRMKLRSLDGAPARGQLRDVGQVYLDDFRAARLTDADAERLCEAFQLAALEAERFPPPAAILRRMPPRYAEPVGDSTQPAPRITTDAEARKNFAIIRKLLADNGLPRRIPDLPVRQAKEESGDG